MSRAGIVLAVGLALLTLAVGLVLSRAPLSVAASNGVPLSASLTSTTGRVSLCQAGMMLPAGTTAIRVSLSANTGPSVAVRVLAGARVLTRGERQAGWGVDETVTVPVRPIAQAVSGAQVCVSTGPAPESFQLNGERVRGVTGDASLLLRLEYLRPGPRSWLSLAGGIARRLGDARAPSGGWVAYLALALTLCAGALAARLVLGGTRAAALTCAAIASLSAASWSLITPPFQAPDEPSHFAYVEQLAQTGHPPNPHVQQLPRALETVLGDLHLSAVQWHPEAQTISSPAALRQLHRDLALPLSRTQPAGAGVASSEPPLYYALATIPYALGSVGTLLDQLELVRLLSALMAGLTAAFTYLFLRESFPGAPWSWKAGGLAAALTPLLGFTSGVVTPDAMLFAECAAVFYVLAGAFRRGLTRRRALALGALCAAGLLTKVNFIGLVPGIALGLLVLVLRRRSAAGRSLTPRQAARVLALGAGVVCVIALGNTLAGAHQLNLVSGALEDAGRQGSPLQLAAYVWQFYLPRLPGMTSYFPGLSTTRELWWDRSVGLFGWLDTSFPVWVDNLALVAGAALAALAARGAYLGRGALRARRAELLVYAAMSVGLMVVIATAAYANLAEGAGFAQARYLMPLLALAAGAVALAVKGAGRRWAPAVGALVVVLFIAADVFSQLLVAGRFYA